MSNTAKTPAEQVWDDATHRRDTATEWRSLSRLQQLMTPGFTGADNVIEPFDGMPWDE